MNSRRVRIISIALVIHVIMLRLTWRDLRNRPDAAVRGGKRIWRLAASLNTTGALAYWLFGRRRSAPAEVEPQP